MEQPVLSSLAISNGNNCNDGRGRAPSVCVWRAAHGSSCWRPKAWTTIRIAGEVGVGRIQVGRWRKRFAQRGLSGIEADLPRSGRKRRIDAGKIVRLTTQSTPQGATHWSTRTLAAKVGISASSVLRIWRTNGLKPHLVET